MYANKKGNIKKLEESFDSNKLNYIINNFEKLRPQFRNLPNEYLNILKNQLKKYLNFSKNNKIKVIYYQKNKYGRYFVKNTPSLQSLPREIRHTIGKDYYIDIDIKNAHPVILLKLCKKYKIECEDLEDYTNNREKHLKELKVSRETGKHIYLKLINGGIIDYNNLKYKSTNIKLFKKEIINIHNSFCEIYIEDYKNHVKEKKKKNINFNLKASFMNKILCNEENKILEKMYEFFKKPNNCVLCFDGIMLDKNKKYDLIKCEEYIKKSLNYEIKLCIKPFDNELKLPSKIDKYIYPQYKFYNDYKKFVNKFISLTILNEWVNNAIVLIDNGGSEYFYTREKHLHNYSDGTKEIVDKWNMKKIENVFNNLEIIIKVLNPYYNLNLEGNINTESKYLFNYLSNKSKKNQGYLQYCKERRLLRNYNKVDYIPYFKKKPELVDTFNLFNGFPLQYKKINYGKMKFEDSKIYNHLKKYFFKEKEELEHFLDFVADMIQDPGVIKGTGHLFYSTQGCGKGLICKLLCKLLGSNNAIIVVNTDRYFEKFNNIYKNKILKIFEEIKEKGSAFHNHNRIKGEITCDEEIVESKGIDQFICRNFSRIIMNSNNENATFVEPGVRRLSYHSLDGKTANNYDYFKPLWEELKNEKYLKCTFDFFKNRKYDIKNVINSYETNYRQEQKNINLPLGIQFMINYIEEKYEKLLNENLNIQSTLLRNEYKEYCKNEGSKYSFKAFKKQIKKIGINEPVRLYLIEKEKKRRVKCFIINPTKIEKKMKDLLKNNKFQFNYEAKEIKKNKNDHLINTEFNYNKSQYIEEFNIEEFIDDEF